MDSRLMDSLFNPSEIAIIGASIDPNKVGGRPLTLLLDAGFPGKIYPVNPHYDDVWGMKCYRHLDLVPSVPELAVIALPAALCVNELERFAKRGGKAAVIISSGYAEVGGEGARLQARIREIADAYGLAICGPNCSGLMNIRKRVMATFSSAPERVKIPAGPVAMVAQSGALSSNFLASAVESGLGFSYWVSTGNEVVCDYTDYLSYFLDDPDTEVVIGYIEDIRDGRRFKQVARKALELGKPLVFLKVGNTSFGARASYSHTTAMARPTTLFDAVFDQLGVIRVRDLGELCDVARACTSRVRPKGKRTVIMAASGGAGVVLSDACEAEGLVGAAISKENKDKLRAVLGPVSERISMLNPIDFPGEVAGRPQMIRQAAEVLIQDEDIDIVLTWAGILRGGGEELLAKDMMQVASRSDKLLAMNWLPAPPKHVLQMLGEARIPYFLEPVHGARAIALLAEYCRRREEYLADEGNMATKRSVQALALGTRNTECLTEYETKEILRRYGFPLPEGGLACTQDDAVVVARRCGYPVVLKIVSPDIVHKSDIGGVRVGVMNEAEVRPAFNQVVRNCRRHKPDAEVLGVLVEEMVPCVAEVIVGFKTDSSFGPVMSFGLGGTAVELQKDVAFWPVPFTRDEARRLISRIKAYSLLTGYRGSPPGDVDSIVETMMSLQYFVLGLGDDLLELEVNPLLVLSKGNGVRIGDALLSICR